MAEIQKAIKIGDIYTNLVEPSTGKSVNYKEVTDWYDGTPMDDSKVDGELYRKVENTYVRKVIDKDGELFLEKDTVDEMRNLSSLEVLMLKAGVYKGVKLNGYYQKGDTPAPIEYYLSDTVEEDDGGSVFEVGGIKLEHEFIGTIHAEYFGIIDGNIFDITSVIRHIISKIAKTGMGISVSQGNYGTDNIRIDGKENIEINFNGSDIEYIGAETPMVYPLPSNSRHITIVDSSGVSIRNLNLKGRMFYGIDINTIDTSEPITTNYTADLYGVYSDNCVGINMEYVNFVDYPHPIRLNNSSFIKMINCGAINSYESYRFVNCEDMIITNCNSYYAKYLLYRNTYGTDPTEYNIGASGRGFLFRDCRNVLMTDCYNEEDATDGYRVDLGSYNVKIVNCKSVNSRRNSFSVYGTANKVVFEGCEAINPANPLVWVGSDTVDTFNRPYNSNQPFAFGVTESAQEVEFVRCKAISATYDLADIPVEDPAMVWNAKSPGSLFRFYNPIHRITMTDCTAIGYTRSGRVVRSGSNGLNISGGYYEGNDSAINGHLTNIFYIQGSDCIVKNATTNKSSVGITLSGDNNIVMDNTIKSAYYSGIYDGGENNIILSNNIVFTEEPKSVDARGIRVFGAGSIVNNNNIDSLTTGVVSGVHLGIDSIGCTYNNNVTSVNIPNVITFTSGRVFSSDNTNYEKNPKALPYKTVSSTSYTADNSDNYLVFTNNGTVTLTLPTGNDNIIPNKQITIKYLGSGQLNIEGAQVWGAGGSVTRLGQRESLTIVYRTSNIYDIISRESPIAATTVKGLVNQAAAVSDVTTADATDETTAIALVNELKAKINEMLSSDRTSGQRVT